jgi:D-2-hydroxyglutarate dehydrogenase
VGGSVPVYDEVILNLGAMDKIISFDEVSGILVCEAGCILENLDNFLKSKGFTMPLDLGAKGSCQIGGNVSTNAGGLRLLRYGSLHGNVLDNTGYDLKQLFIGSEGTLGVVTKVSILVPSKLGSVNTAFLACDDFESCQNVLKEAKLQLGEILSAFEFIDRPALDIALSHLSGTRDPLPESWKSFYLLIETTGSNDTHDKEKLDAFLESTMEKGLVADGVVAQGISQAASFWQIREGIAEALGKAGAVYKYDFSLAPRYFYKIVEDLRDRLGSAAVVVAYGHLGDGNVHLNVSARKYDNELLEKIEPYVFEWVAKHKGSVSAEHGLGLMKPHALHYSKSDEAISLMWKFKNLLDPKGILNPYKVLPTSSNTVSSPATATTAVAAEIF